MNSSLRGQVAFFALGDAQILQHAQVAKDGPVLGHKADAHGGDVKAALSLDLLAVKDHLALAWRGQPQDRLERGGFARAVAAQQGDDAAFGHLHGHSLQDVELADVGVNVVDLQKIPVFHCVSSSS